MVSDILQHQVGYRHKQLRVYADRIEKWATLSTSQSRLLGIAMLKSRWYTCNPHHLARCTAIGRGTWGLERWLVHWHVYLITSAYRGGEGLYKENFGLERTEFVR